MRNIPILHFLLIGIRINSIVYSEITSSRGGCVLPSNLANSRFCSFECDDCFRGKWTYEPGDTVKHLVRVQCEPGHELARGRVQKVALCHKGNWIPSIPHCYSVCPPLKSDAANVTCFDGQVSVDCSLSSALPGTTASWKCKPFHVATDDKLSKDLVCSSAGHWSGTLPKCVPECGVAHKKPITEGEKTLTSYPWHAGVYRRDTSDEDVEKWSYACGGTLVSTRIVLTAAHCVVELNGNTPMAAGSMRVALGKFYLSWDDPEEYSVKRKVVRITVADGYQGQRTYYAKDLSSLVLSEPVPVNPYIMPVCVPLGQSEDARSAWDSSTGHVLTWTNSPESNVLTHYQVSLDRGTCTTRVKGSLLTDDKFCGIMEPQAGSGDSKRFYSGAALTAEINNQHYLLGLGSAEYNGIGLYSNTSRQGLVDLFTNTS